MIRFLSLTAVLLFVMASSAWAVNSITAVPNPATTGQPVSFTIGTSFASIQTGCSVTVDFGDQINATFVPVAGNSLQTVQHSYTAGGTYQAIASSAGCVLVAADPPVSTTVIVTTFGITRLELAFPDGKGQALVRRNEQGLRATATLATIGSGLLQGYWEVDGRVLTRIDQFVTFGQTIKLETPQIPALPTFDPGTHLLRFVITSPVPQQQNRFGGPSADQLPTLVYTVTPDEGRPIQLHSPLPEALLPFGPASFGWHAQTGAGHYELKFLAPDGNPVFAALTKTPDYRLNELALRKYFAPGTRYLWQVQAFDTDGRPAGESKPAPFGFQEKGQK